MRKPCSLLQDLFTLISEAAFEPQRNLHFPLFRHAGTRVVKPRERRGRPLSDRFLTDYSIPKGAARPKTVMPGQPAPDASAPFPVRELSIEVSPQMELFAAAA